MMNIKVTKRNGKKEPLMLDKILERINQQTYGLDAKWIQPFDIAQKVIEGITPDIETRVLDTLSMETAAALTVKHPDYATLAARIIISNHQKNTEPLFSNVMKNLYEFTDIHGNNKPLIAYNVWNFIHKYQKIINNMIVHDRDYLIDFFGFKTLERAYLFRIFFSREKSPKLSMIYFSPINKGSFSSTNSGPTKNHEECLLIYEFE